MGKSAAGLLCLFVLDLPQTPFPSRRFRLCQTLLPVRAEPDGLVLGLERLPEPQLPAPSSQLEPPAAQHERRRQGLAAQGGSSSFLRRGRAVWKAWG